MSGEHDKPFRLTATYTVSAEPTALTASYDLHATFLGVPETELPVTQNINGLSFLATDMGSPKLMFTQYIQLTGSSYAAFTNPKIYNKLQKLTVPSFVNTTFGTVQIRNKNQAVTVSGFINSAFTKPYIYNLRQYVSLASRGFNSHKNGTAYVQGGVKFVNTNGFNASAVAAPKAINTRADQYVDLHSPSRGIAPPSITRPNVSPRILYPLGILPGPFGTAWVQRNPSPKGFITDSYGTAWVSHSPRYITPFKVEAFLSGYAKVFDPMQRIHHEGSPPIPAGIFGDVAIKNTRRIVNVPGSDQSLYGDWSEVHSNLITAGVQSFDANLFGNTEIRNKTPSVIPGAWDSATFGNTFISDRIRRINARGIDWPESQRFGKHVLTKPPEIKPAGFNAMRFGQSWISNKTRELSPPGINTLRFSDPVVWFRYRHISVNGIGIPGFAQPKVEHGLRFILGRGDSHLRFGSPIVWFRVRKLIPSSIYREFESKHLIGGTQHILPSGFIATKFGERIVPENQAVYPLGFNGQAFSEKNQIELYKRWVRPNGFLTFGVQTSDRYGNARIWNKRQYVQHNYDSGDGLNPGSFGQWTSIANRNRVIGAQGFTATKFGNHAIVNNARLLAPAAIQATNYGKLMIADRIRHLRPGGMESPYISGWGRIHNAAFVIAPIAGKYDQWGHPSVVNTRREYRWVGAFDSMVFGQPMIALRIRKLSLESRYSIYQPSMPLPKVDLYTRYIEPIGPELEAFGGPSLNIKWNTFTPRWTHRNYFGEPRVHNVTPEVKQRGNVSEEFGRAAVKLHKQYLPVDGYGSELWGKSGIAFRDRSMTISGNNYMAFGLHRVVKTGAPPYSLQQITLDWAGEDERPDDYNGLGISIPEGQVPPPKVKTNVVFASGFIATAFGNHHTQSNGILIDAGIQEFAIGNHNVGLKNRAISVPTLGDLLQIRDARPRLSPHTIYAVMEAPSQARENNPYQNIHYVSSDSGRRPPGEVFGNPRVTLRHRKIYLGGFNQSSIPQPTVMLKRRYIRVTGFSTFRVGWHFALDGSPQDVEQYESRNMQAFGRPYLVSPYYGPQKIRVGGINASSIGTSRVEHFHRTIRASGSSMMIMGASRGGDTAYKPQSLWVGRPMPTIPAGFNAEKFGNTTIGLRVRDVGVFGFDAFNAESDISNFKGRLKVIQVKQPQVIEPKEIYPQSFGHTAYGVPDIRLKVHYIRPDGNSNQFRKGGST